MSVHDATFDQSNSPKNLAKLLCAMMTSTVGATSSYPFYLVGLLTQLDCPFGLFLLENMDKLNITCGCPSLSFLNTGERPMSLLNISLSGLH